jgi:hypothetical protein
MVTLHTMLPWVLTSRNQVLQEQAASIFIIEVRYVNTISVFMDIIHRPVFIYLFGPEIWTSSIEWAQLSRFHLKTETESSPRNIVSFK